MHYFLRVLLVPQRRLVILALWLAREREREFLDRYVVYGDDVISYD